MDAQKPTEMHGRQTRKRLATRQRISDAATRLFLERGFDAVTVDEIAEAADVSRMTVFNHFARKEDMFFDLDEVGRRELAAALEERAAGVSPVEALRLFAHWAVREGRPYTRFFGKGTKQFVNTIRKSEVLQARVRAIREELQEMLAEALARSVGRDRPDADSHLAAAMVLVTWTVAIEEATREFERTGKAARARALLLGLVDQGARGVAASVKGTPYASRSGKRLA